MTETTPAPWAPGTQVEYTKYWIGGQRQARGVVVATRTTRSGRYVYTVESEAEGREIVPADKLTPAGGDR